jgi:hypothetical protein
VEKYRRVPTAPIGPATRRPINVKQKEQSMTTWLKIERGALLNPNEVVRIWRHRGTRVAQLKDGGEVELDCDAALYTTIVPAAAAFELLVAWSEDEGDPIIDRHPIIAWKVGEEVEPIVHHSVPDYGYVGRCVRYPCGRCVDPVNGVWPDERGWRDEMRDWAQKDRARRDEVRKAKAERHISELIG